MRFRSLIVVTYARSGSTLLQGVLNTIPGVLIRGENNNFAYSIYKSYQALRDANGYAFTQDAHNATHPWYGIQDIDFVEYLRTCADLIRNVIVPHDLRDSIQCHGFKEVRYPYKLDALEAYLAFLRQVMPQLGVIFNFREHDAVIRSGIRCGWWKGEAWNAMTTLLGAFEARATAYKQEHPDDSLIVYYEDVVARSRSFRELFDFIAADHSETAISQVLQMTHSTRTQDTAIKNDTDAFPDLSSAGQVAGK